MANNRLILRTLNSPWVVPAPDLTKGSVLTHSDVDNNFIYLKGEDIYSVDSSPSIIKLNKVNGSSLTISLSASTNTYTSGTTIVGNTIYFDRNDSLSAYTADLTSVLSGVTLTDGNGTTASGNSVGLGGALTSNAVISGGGKNLELGTSTNLLNDIKINSTTGSETYSGGSLTNIASNTPTSFDRKVTDGDAVTLFEGYPASLDLKATKPTLSGESRVYVTPQAVEISQTNTTTNKGGRLQLTTSSSDYTYTDGANITSQLFMSSASTNVTISEIGGGNSGLIIKPEESLLFTDNASLKLTPTDTTFTDGRATTKGIEYASDYSSGWTVNSLVTKGYVDSSSGGSGNNIYNSNGTLVSNIIVTQGNKTLTFDGAGGFPIIKQTEGAGTNGQKVLEIKANHVGSVTGCGGYIDFSSANGNYNVGRIHNYQFGSSNAGFRFYSLATDGTANLGSSYLGQDGHAALIGENVVARVSTEKISLQGDTLIKGIVTIQNGGNTYGKWFANGDVALGGGTIIGVQAGITLHKNTLIKGEGTGSSDNCFQVLDSGNNGLFKVFGDGTTIIGGTSLVGTEKISLQGDTLIKGSDALGTTSGFKVTNSANAVSLNVTNDGSVSSISTSTIPSFTARGDGSSVDGYIKLNCWNNNHGIKLKAPPHSAAASYTLTFPDGVGSSGQFLKTDGSGNLSWGTGGGTSTLNNGDIFVGNASNVATSVTMTGDTTISNTGVVTIGDDKVTYGKMQDTTQAALLGNTTGSGTVAEIPIIEQYISNSGTVAGYLNNTAYWDINGNYLGTSPSITGTYQGQSHYNGDYWFTAVADNVWIRLIRG